MRWRAAASAALAAVTLLGGVGSGNRFDDGGLVIAAAEPVHKAHEVIDVSGNSEDEDELDGWEGDASFADGEDVSSALASEKAAFGGQDPVQIFVEFCTS
mmetsp:Transcript_11330/g.22085  ORF Transcript_11330/g.22085 Transcript_11330/m.22085 type:complete len:100 (+) Transcript_11330:145-444(+)